VHVYFFEQINDYDGDNKLYDNDMYFSLQMTSSQNINFVNNSQKILLLIKIPRRQHARLVAAYLQSQ